MTRTLIKTGMLSAAFAMSAFCAHAVEDDPERGWGKTNLDFSLVTHFTRTVHPCERSATHFFACVRLINKLGEFANPRQGLIPRELARTEPRMDFGALLWVDVDPATDSAARESALLLASAQQLRLQRETRVAARIDFDHLGRQILAAKRGGVSAAYALGMAVNELIAVHDSHGRLAVFEYEMAQIQNADRNFGGIGAILDDGPDQRIQVVAVHKSTPAERAGLQAKDVVLAIDGRDVTGQSALQLAQRLRGPPESRVTLLLERDGRRLPAVELVREKISLPNLEIQEVADMGVPILWIKLTRFSDDFACLKIRRALTQLRPEVRGIILDLRGNRGGLLEQGVCLTGLFVGERIIGYTRSVNGGSEEPAKELPSDQLQMTYLPLVVLIDHNSASASELVAGALRDHGRAFLLGTRSFGKGSVQKGDRYKPFPQLMLYETKSRFYQPLGYSVQLTGLEPDFEYFVKPQPSDEERFARRERDISLSALPPTGPVWRQERATQIQRAKEQCLSRGLSDLVFGGRDDGDYQMLKAQELLSCPIVILSGRN